MWLKNCVILLIVLIYCNDAQLTKNHRFRQFPFKAAENLRHRLRARIYQYRERNTQMICYETVGCFSLPHGNSPLQRVPEDPHTLSTKFYLFTRKNNFSMPEVLFYNDGGKSITESSFNPKNKLKVLVHGYTSKWNEKNALLVADAYLQLDDYNVLLMDWKIGARGPQYVSAAANSEIVGRELGILLLKLVEKGSNPRNMHLIGFSLGAHVAGTASEILKEKGYLLGRITGLDAAGPLFRNNYFKEKHKKLDRSDAELVDVIHTDASPYLTDGFGLWEPIGHVDFYPNGGQEQPGCTDLKNSIVITHLENRPTLDRDSACSHIRAFRLYIETVLNKVKNKNKKADYCQFTAFNCNGGLPSFESGHCFPQLEKANSRLAIDRSYIADEIGQIGEDVRGRGVMYLSTRSTSPHCGTQLQASVHISQKTDSIKGFLKMNLIYSNMSVDFEIFTDVKDFIITGSRMYGLAVAEFGSLDPDSVKEIEADLFFFNPDIYENRNETFVPPMNSAIYIDKIIVRDMFGNSWQYCFKDMSISDTIIKRITLRNKLC